MRSHATSGPSWFGKLAESALDLLFPPACIVCHRHGEWLCAECLGLIDVVSPPLCNRCGSTLVVEDASRHSESQGAEVICERCSKTPPRVDGLRSYGYYTGPLRKAVHQLKYADLRALARPLGDLMSEAWLRTHVHAPDINMIVPVPLHRLRERERGYNQAALLARELGSRLGLPVGEDLLVRSRATAPQVGLDSEQREANVAGAFQCVAPELANMKVLLIDDVITTGSTLGAACAALKNAGASAVWACTLARARQPVVPVAGTPFQGETDGSDNQGQER